MVGLCSLRCLLFQFPPLKGSADMSQQGFEQELTEGTEGFFSMVGLCSLRCLLFNPRRGMRLPGEPVLKLM